MNIKERQIYLQNQIKLLKEDQTNPLNIAKDELEELQSSYHQLKVPIYIKYNKKFMVIGVLFGITILTLLAVAVSVFPTDEDSAEVGYLGWVLGLLAVVISFILCIIFLFLSRKRNKEIDNIPMGEL